MFPDKYTDFMRRHLPRNKTLLVRPVSGLTFTQTAFPAKASGKMVESLKLLSRMLTVAGAAQAALTFRVKVPDSRLTTTIESNREHLTSRIIYNMGMDQNNSDMNLANPQSLSERMDAISVKLETLQQQIKVLVQEKSFMENKISDAQGRIQKILNKLPQTTDTRQLTLLDNSAETPHE